MMMQAQNPPAAARHVAGLKRQSSLGRRQHRGAQKEAEDLHAHRQDL